MCDVAHVCDCPCNWRANRRKFDFDMTPWRSKKVRRRLGLLVASVALGLPFVASPADTGAFAHGPYGGFTGAPGEDTCRHCHSGEKLNFPGGELAISGFPATYTPGETYTVTITLSSPVAKRWGFEATVLNEKN